MTRKEGRALTLKFERVLPAPPGKVFDAWMGPTVPGTIWSVGEELLIDPRKNGLFYLKAPGRRHYHYGRFTELKRPLRIQHTWMTWYTQGLESLVTATFRKKGKGTRMTLIHSGLPDTAEGRSHEVGWNQFLDLFTGYFNRRSRRAK